MPDNWGSDPGPKPGSAANNYFADDAGDANYNNDPFTARGPQPGDPDYFADDAGSPEYFNKTMNINPKLTNSDNRKAQRNADLKIPGGNWKFPLEQSAQYSGRIRFFVYEQRPLDLNTTWNFNSWMTERYNKFQEARSKLKKGSSAEVTSKKVNVYGSSNTFDDDMGHDEDLSYGGQFDTNLSDTVRSSTSTSNITANRKQISDEAQAFQKQTEEGTVNKDFLKFQMAKPRRWVDMYIPISLQIDDNVQYDNAQLGIMGQALLSGMAQNGEIISAIGKSMSEGTSDVFNLFGGNLGEEAARLAAIRVSGKLPKIQNAVSVSQQRAINPNVRAIFRGVNLRQFSFTFKMIPTSEREAIEISNIIRFFRIEVYPESKVAGNHGSVMYKFPNVFDISFKYGGGSAKIPRLNKCFLTGVQSNFNPTQASFHQDGYPSEVDLTLRFLEIRTLDKQDVLDQHEYQGAPGSRQEMSAHKLSHDLSIINST